jgi:mono/diheme cytochrome c family protein
MRIGAAAALLVLAVPAGASAQAAGQSLFNDNCSACHERTGLGVKGAFPPLAGNKLVQGPPAVAAATVLVGRGGMPSFKSDFTDAQLAAILTYVRASWGNKAPAVTPAQVATARKQASAAAQPAGLQAH